MELEDITEERLRARIAELETALKRMVYSVPGGSNCDPQAVSDELRAIASGAGVRVDE